MKPQATNGKASVGAKPSEVRSLDICHQHSLTSHALGCGEVKRTRRAVWHLDEVKLTTADASLGQKRSAPVDPEEEERRRKRAERFGLPVPKAAPAETEEDERSTSELNGLVPQQRSDLVKSVYLDL